jgi:hypothetical protein
MSTSAVEVAKLVRPAATECLPDRLLLGLSAAFLAAIPSTIACARCRKPLASIEQNATEGWARVRLYLASPPVVTDADFNVGQATCESCGSRNPVDLRSIGFAPEDRTDGTAKARVFV